MSLMVSFRWLTPLLWTYNGWFPLCFGLTTVDFHVISHQYVFSSKQNPYPIQSWHATCHQGDLLPHHKSIMLESPPAGIHIFPKGEGKATYLANSRLSGIDADIHCFDSLWCPLNHPIFNLCLPMKHVVLVWKGIDHFPLFRIRRVSWNMCNSKHV